MTTIETTPTAPPEGFVAHILKETGSVSGDFEAQLRAVIAETWKRARQEESSTIQDAALRYIHADALLGKKVARVRQIIRNTINKRNLKTPARFQWVHGWNEYSIGGFYRNEAASYQNPRYKALDPLIAIGAVSGIDRNDFIKIISDGPRTNYEFIPLSWLTLSDGELSKMVRNEVRHDESKNRAEKLKTLMHEKSLVEKNLLKLQRQIDEMNPKR